MTTTRLRLVALVVAVAGLAAGCATPPTASTVASPSTSVAAATGSPAPTCSSEDGATASYSPSQTSSYADEIRARNYLVVGVSADTRLLGAVDPSNPNTFKGFDIEVAKAVANALWPSGGESKIRYKVINAAQRIPFLQNPVDKGGVDLVVRAFTITCARWKQISFSSEYFSATQKILVPASSTATAVADLAEGSKVCAPKGSTSIETIKNTAEYKKFVPVEVANHTDCLALFQQGKVDAITGDDAILAGFQDQDPKASKVLKDSFGLPQPYGVGLPKSHPDFVQYVNYVLEGFRKDRWQKAFTDTGLQAALSLTAPPTPPKPLYGRPVGQ